MRVIVKRHKTLARGEVRECALFGELGRRETGGELVGNVSVGAGETLAVRAAAAALAALTVGAVGASSEWHLGSTEKRVRETSGARANEGGVGDRGATSIVRAAAKRV
jgi:hypothetical protein